MRIWMRRLGLLLGLATLLAGCSSAGLFTLVDVIDSDSNDGDVNAATLQLSRRWTVRTYSGETVGAVTVPGAAEMAWTFVPDGSFTVQSSQPVPIGPDRTMTYNESGRWRLINAAKGQMELTLTRRAGISIPSGDQVAVATSYTLIDNQLIVITTAIGPGSVRYVMAP